MSQARARLAVAGAGLIGKRHAQAIVASERADLTAVIDPAQPAREFANAYGVRWARSLDELFDRSDVDGVVLATPNQLHVTGALTCIEAGIPVLIEKPITSELDDARKIIATAEENNVAIAVGHHRRHNPLVARAKEIIDRGDLGTISTVHGNTWFYKPDDYFEAGWRRTKGAGPVYLNLIHDIDLFHHFLGPVSSVQAMESNFVRGNEVEDTAVILLRFLSGALATLNVCDTAVAPWSWELTARENPAYPATGQDCYWIGGTEGSLSLPNLALWSNAGSKSWWEPISSTKHVFGFDDPLICQAEQFAAVILDHTEPLVTGRDGLAALEVVEAIKSAAATGQLITLERS